MDLTTVLGLTADRTAVANWAPVYLYKQLSALQNKYSFSNLNLISLKVYTPLACWAFTTLILCVCTCVRARTYGRGVHRVLIGKPEGKRPMGRPRRSWEDNIKMDLQEVGGSCGDWMELAHDRDRWRALVSTVRNLRVPKMRGIS